MGMRIKNGQMEYDSWILRNIHALVLSALILFGVYRFGGFSFLSSSPSQKGAQTKLYEIEKSHEAEREIINKFRECDKQTGMICVEEAHARMFKELIDGFWKNSVVDNEEITRRNGILWEMMREELRALQRIANTPRKDG